ncbi:hypothetical protein F3J44_02860 [Pantoea sp. Tr-811]|uniref:hypothetical protein n=1 Tax=Pantoea sp. Tr-811 TaxID=2608361 RepID=UPI00141FC921|nr:hypothetical protein [Pantoea sp. Tr-811]NIF25317.1 hypothetical protein [Pantoea sp. Tr-811]
MTTVTPGSGNQSAAVIEQSLLAFGLGIDPAIRNDIKNAYQYASLVASRRFPNEGQTEQWFAQFIDVMRDCGWVALKRTYERERAQTQSLKLGAIAFKGMKVVGQAVLSNPLTDALAQLAADALEGLGQVTEAQDILLRNLKEKKTGTVGLGACIQNEAGEVILAMSAIDSTPFADHELNTVVFEWKSTAIELYTGSAVFAFNSDLYGSVRADIRNKLQDRAVRNVLDYDI